jgi:hypothetical protein
MSKTGRKTRSMSGAAHATTSERSDRSTSNQQTSGMKPEIDRKELQEIVAEAARIEQQQSEQLDLGQVAEILRELDLPAEHLPEARRILAERRLSRARARRRYAAGGLAVIIAALAGFGLWWRSRSEAAALATMVVSRAQIELDGQPVAGPVPHDVSARVVFEVVIARPPQGAELELECRWKDPRGVERHVNRWSTRPVDHDQWPTRCRHEFDAKDASGIWSVTMSSTQKQLATERFTLK